MKANRPASRARKWLINSTLLLASTLLSLALIEIGARLLQVGRAQPRGVMEWHETNFFIPRSGGERLFFVPLKDGKERRVSYTFSAQGIRDREYDAKTPGEFRILLLGDSFAMGHGLEIEETISRQLERAIADAAENVTVVNAGVYGYSPWQERTFLRERGFNLAPDLILLQLYPANDVDGSLEQYGRHLLAYNREWKSILQAWRHGDTWPSRAERWLMQNSRAYTGLLSATGRDLLLSVGLRKLSFLPGANLPPLPPSANRPHGIETNLREDYAELTQAWSLLEQSLKAIRDDCAQRDIPLIVFAIPSREVVVDALWSTLMKGVDDPTQYDRGKALRRVTTICTENAIPYIDIHETIASHPNPESLYYLLDGHLNPTGATYVANALAKPIQIFLSKKPKDE